MTENKLDPFVGAKSNKNAGSDKDRGNEFS